MNISKRTSFILIVIFSTILVLDSAIVKFSSFSGTSYPAVLNVAIFTVFYIIFAAASLLLIKSVKKLVYKYEYNLVLPYHPRFFYYVISITLLTSFIIILAIILQLTILNEYTLFLVRAQIYIGHISALIFLSLLIFLFVRWLTSRRDYSLLLYAVSLSLLSLALIISLIYIDSNFATRQSSVRPVAIHFYISCCVEGSPFTESLSTVFDILSLSSFLLMWIATAKLLSQYRYRMGRLRYFSVICVPLIYYIFPFQGYFGEALFPLLISSPLIFSAIYVLIFSATKQVGAGFFGLSFWFASGLVYDDRVRRTLLVSSIGMVILFSSISLAPLQFGLYPPYGLITEAFIPLGAYLLLVGIFTSATQISRDAVIRRELYRSAINQLDLLRSIGTSEMEKEFEARVKYLEKVNRISEIPSHSKIAEQVEVENVKKILHEVLEEVHSKDRKKDSDNSI